MCQVVPFQFDTISIRAAKIGGDSWFVGEDIATTLGYANPNKAMSDHCKGATKRHPLHTEGGVQDVRIISEPDLFRLVVNSRLSDAERFERWIFEEVLPMIRRTGGYSSHATAAPSFVGDGCALIESGVKVLRLAPSVTLGM